MLTEKDISTLIARMVAVVATKDDVKILENRLDAFQDSFDKLTAAVDKLAGAVQDLRLEYAAVSTQLSRHEEWLKKLADKVGLKLEY